MRLNKCLLSISFIPMMLLSCCVHKGLNPADPYESFNRKVYCFNTVIDNTFIKPPAKLYKTIVPNCVRKSVNNFYNNLDGIPTVINDLLQAEGQCAIKDTWRFFINSTLGIGGLFDFAQYCNLPPHSNDLGLTLAKWGDKESPYLVIPFLGPSTIRDASGLLVQFSLYSPYVYLRNNTLIYSLLGLRFIDLRAQLLDVEHLMNEALDDYSFLRDAYLQHRAFMLSSTNEETGSTYVDDNDPGPATTEAAPGNDYVEE